MRKIESHLLDARIEVVTTTFVASGRPAGIHDLDRFIESLNDPRSRLTSRSSSRPSGRSTGRPINCISMRRC